jgi:hypothetical protein
MLEVPVGQKREVALAAIIPRDAPATMYSVFGYFAADEGTPADRKSSPVNVFYFPPVEFQGTDVAAATAGAKIAVDSSYEGYDAHPLNDGIMRPAPTAPWTDAAWASKDNGDAHWIEITLPQPEEVSRLVVVWAYDNGNLYASQCCILQVERDGKWQDLGELVSKTLPAYSVLDFEPTTATRFRLYQPAGEGPVARPGIMWVTEVGLYRQ